MLQMCKMIVSPGAFSMLKFWLSRLSRDWKGKEWPNMSKISVCRTFYFRNHVSYDFSSTIRKYSSRNANNVPLVRINNNYFMNTFFPSATTEWNKLDLSSCKSASLNIFKSRLLRFVRPLENSVFTCHNPIGIKYLTRIRLGFSHLRYHKFKHGFLDAIDPLCSCSTGIENTVHYFLHCPNFSTARNTFLNEIAIVDRSIIDQDEIKIIQTFL